MQVIQINLNHCEVEQDLLLQRMAETEKDVPVVSKPKTKHTAKFARMLDEMVDLLSTKRPVVVEGDINGWTTA
ncbi:hypothetical protein AND_002796 [Anopheles darlingi]|uniref:Uncharacterized protein n=1 Tax=Anopheles darlingi TaxID=43151 RepID=W5JM56_ANODA|nr:hypothetical protein AND_002796 [Anopheles darlingi]